MMNENETISSTHLFACNVGKLRLTAYAPGVTHVLFRTGDIQTASSMWGILPPPEVCPNLDIEELEDCWQVGDGELSIAVDRFSGNLTVRDGSSRQVLKTHWFQITPAVVSGERTHHVGASFKSPAGERFYGLGQHQHGHLDHAGRTMRVWHSYHGEAAEGESIGVPLLLSSEGYAVVWDNPSRTTCTCGLDGITRWDSEVGEAVSFFVVHGPEMRTIYARLRGLLGAAPLPPRAALGYWQCKQRYASQAELLAVAETHRAKGYPGDILVVDWFHWQTLGDLDLDPVFWPDPAAMNRRLAELGFRVMISCWPRFMSESRHFRHLDDRGWLMKNAFGQTVNGVPDDQRGAVIDTTNPETRAWYWEQIRDSYGTKGFCCWWLDENEPDVCPQPFYFHAGTGARLHNLYPLLHTQAVYEGHRRDRADRCLILSRSSYLGAHRHGTTFWSSDIDPTWDVLRRQVPTGQQAAVSLMPYWSSDIGGWQALPKNPPPPAKPPLLDPEPARAVVGAYDDYVELYVRWFQYGAFCPTFRAHGTRPANEVWSYGPEAERILAKYLRLRYRLMPYLNSLAFETWQTGMPMMRPVFFDFPADHTAWNLPDQYLFGPAFLVAPVVEQGATSRPVYLPGGTDWYDFWTGRRYAGGQTIDADAPIDTLPLLVRAGSILPLGHEVQHTGEVQRVNEIRVYRGADGHFDLFLDDGLTYAYERGEYGLVSLRWNDTTQCLKLEGDVADSFAAEAESLIKKI